MSWGLARSRGLGGAVGCTTPERADDSCRRRSVAGVTAAARSWAASRGVADSDPRAGQSCDPPTAVSGELSRRSPDTNQSTTRHSTAPETRGDQAPLSRMTCRSARSIEILRGGEGISIFSVETSARFRRPVSFTTLNVTRKSSIGFQILHHLVEIIAHRRTKLDVGQPRFA